MNKCISYLSASILTIEKHAKIKELGIQDEATNTEIAQRLIFYGIKSVITRKSKAEPTLEEIEALFGLLSKIKGLVSELTPAQFMEIFPISKKYDGAKNGVKDYFHTKNYIEKLPQDEPIGDNSLMFLSEYVNKDIDLYNIKSILTVSKLRELNGYPSLGEEFMDSIGIPSPNIHRTSKGDRFIIINGKPTRLTQPLTKASHLSIVK